MKRKALYSALAACLILVAGTSYALLPNFSKEELIQKSDAIVLGTITGLSSSWTEDHAQIYTYATLRVEAQFKGQPVGQEMVIQIPGGTVGETTEWVSDTPELEVGMRLILHTFVQDTGYPWIYGWKKGALTVVNSVIPDYTMTLDQFRRLVEETN